MRQVFGATELTISKNDDGSFNTEDILMFMKGECTVPMLVCRLSIFSEISSDGNMNTVDVIFPSWPAFLYTNPTLGKYLLLPLFEYQATGQYPNKYSVHDMGACSLFCPFIYLSLFRRALPECYRAQRRPR